MCSSRRLSPVGGDVPNGMNILKEETAVLCRPLALCSSKHSYSLLDPCFQAFTHMIKIMISIVMLTDDESSFKSRHAPGTKSAGICFSDIIGIARLSAVKSGDTEQAKQMDHGGNLVLFLGRAKVEIDHNDRFLQSCDKIMGRWWSHEHKRNEFGRCFDVM